MSTTEPISLDPPRTALVNVHWQHDIVTPDGAFAPFFAESVRRHGVIDTTRALVDAVRTAGALVTWARAAFQPGYPELILNTGLNHAIKDLGALIDGSPGAQIIPELAPETMNRWSATRYLGVPEHGARRHPAPPPDRHRPLHRRRHQCDRRGHRTRRSEPGLHTSSWYRMPARQPPTKRTTRRSSPSHCSERSRPPATSNGRCNDTKPDRTRR
ncbi:isochorismatase family protein [Rhodococcus opacus]|nr:isochorismatase family protein [Rhodococcus opacus]